MRQIEAKNGQILEMKTTTEFWKEQNTQQHYLHQTKHGTRKNELENAFPTNLTTFRNEHVFD